MLKCSQAGPNHFTRENGESHPPVRFADPTSDAWQCNEKDINVPTLRIVCIRRYLARRCRRRQQKGVWSRLIEPEDSEFHLGASEVTE
jgi:hypothetical protein